MAQNPYACLDALVVRLEGKQGAFRLCGNCGFYFARLHIHDQGTHKAELKCTDCGARVSWVGESHLASMKAQHAAGGKVKHGHSSERDNEFREAS